MYRRPSHSVRVGERDKARESIMSVYNLARRRSFESYIATEMVKVLEMVLVVAIYNFKKCIKLSQRTVSTFYGELIGTFY